MCSDCSDLASPSRGTAGKVEDENNDDIFLRRYVKYAPSLFVSFVRALLHWWKQNGILKVELKKNAEDGRGMV